MKNIFILISLLIITTTATFAQSRLGSSAVEIKEEFSDAGYHLQSGYDKDNDYYIVVTMERATVWYYFNTDKRCTLTLIQPLSQGLLNFYVELYNKQYVVLSPKKWKMYADNGIATITLIQPETTKPFFSWAQE